MAGRRVVTFSGYPWAVRPTQDSHEPGPNAWSDSEQAASLGADGVLTLQIFKDGGDVWRSVELEGPHLGYGQYTWVVDTDPAAWPVQPVLGLFTYDETDDGSAGYREIDIELATWGRGHELSRGWYALQPSESFEERAGDHGLTAHRPYTCSFIWEPGQVFWRTTDATGAVLGEHKAIEGVPQPGGETVRMNLWLLGGRPPGDGRDVPVRISDFTFIPGVRHSAPGASSISMDFSRGAEQVALKRGTAEGGGPRSRIVSGALQLECTGPDPSLAYTGSVFDLTGSSVDITVLSVPAVGNGTTRAVWQARFDDTDYLGIYLSGGTLCAESCVAGVRTTAPMTTVEAPFSQATHAHWRLRESQGTALFEYSADGASWVTGASMVHGLGAKVSNLRLRFECDCSGPETAPGPFRVAAINGAGAPGPLTSI